MSPVLETIVPTPLSKAAPPPILAFAPGHPMTTYAQVYARSRRIHIPGVFAEDSARWLYDVLSTATCWNTVLNSDVAVYDLTPETIQSFAPGQWDQFRNAFVASASQSFKYMFENCRLSEAGEPFGQSDHPLGALVAFLNAPETLRTFRQITGHAQIARVDVQATRYGPGHFLHPHDDIDETKGRLAAYVLNMTPEWRAEWGGVLNFLDEDGHVAEGYVPRFNAINIFDVGMSHYVSYVAPFATHPRLSVTGWLRTA
jgi:SM-20-related protein